MEKANSNPENKTVVSPWRRLSSRLEGINKQRAEKTELVRKRLKLLDENRGSRGKKRHNPDNEDVESVEKKQNKKEKSGESSGAIEVKTGDEPVIQNSGGDEPVIPNPGGDDAVKSASARAKEILRLFNKHYLHFVQEEEKAKKQRKPSPVKDGAKKRTVQRPDLKAAKRITDSNLVMYPEKRIGELPGINVGHQFYSRAEMIAIGFHSHTMGGIDYMGIDYKKKYKNYNFPLAVAIVLSGLYEDNKDNAEEIVYTGQGGNNLIGNKRQNGDQEMKRGNLALKNCVDQSVPVRVVRGHKCKSSYSKKIYTYDGLYNVVAYWKEKGLSEFNVYKYRLRRVEGQPTLTTNQVLFIKGDVPKSVSVIKGLACKDISGSLEKFPIPATNLVDDTPIPPPSFTYSKSLQVAKNIEVPANASGCKCKGSCVDARRCACARLNGSDFPYVQRDGGRLIEAKAVVFECGPKCGCGPDCVNRTSQSGIKYRLEVFRTPKKGWGVRSWDFIPSGAPVCEYIGKVMRNEDMDNIAENNYIFEIDCVETIRGIDGRESRLGNVPVEDKIDVEDDPSSEHQPDFCIDAGSTGNVARFINHSCEPNLFVQCVLSSHHDLKLARIMLFAADNIPPLQELTYDYGYILDSVRGPDGKIKEMACYCGAAECRKRLF
ncbi:Histone-lysine N-methyltransferase H3 lysine-9 specific SUVH4 [Euphorbia peplus]|nr:Histone-lysine N-methyltransferase H3 lysine-9 specific SUVH4 [Euphorbia peplus]